MNYDVHVGGLAGFPRSPRCRAKRLVYTPPFPPRSGGGGGEGGGALGVPAVPKPVERRRHVSAPLPVQVPSAL